MDALRWVIVLSAVFVAYAVYSAFKYTRMISNIFLSLVYQPQEELLPQPRGEKITIVDSSDREMEALFVECRDSRKLVIFCPESGSSKESWGKYAYFLPALGWNLLSVDFGKLPATGRNSLLQWPTTQDVDKLLTAIRWTKAALGSDLDIVLFGVSKGADVALAASFEYPWVKGVIADGLFSVREIFRDYIRKWAPILVRPNLFGQEYPNWIVSPFTDLGFWYCQKKTKVRIVDVEKLLRRRHVGLLMIHGAEDDYISPSHQGLLGKLSDKRCFTQHRVIPQAKHNEAVIVSRLTYEDNITDFLQRLS